MMIHDTKTTASHHALDLVIGTLAPPRSSAKKMIPMIAHWQPKRIVHNSCGPNTFARDVGLLREIGYTLSDVGIMDMFPHTEHVEVMGVLDRQ